MEQIADEANLREAFRRVETNQGAPGPDGRTVQAVRADLTWTLEGLRGHLLRGTYRPGMIRRVFIPKAGGGERGLGIPDVKDRVVQQAILQRIERLFEPGFHDSSHGFRSGRSCHTAIAEAKLHVSAGFEWVVDMDLEKFFDRVPHQRLLARLATRIRDKRILVVIGRMLRARVVLPDGVVTTTEEGTPQGGPLSPLLSNVVLDELDQELTRRGHRFVRYADDTNIYVRTKVAGERVFRSLTKFVEGRLRLVINRTKSAVARTDSRHFLGFRLLARGRARPQVGISERTEERLRRRIVELTPRIWGDSLRRCIQAINGYLRGWAEFFGIAEGVKGITQWVDGHVRRRLRMILLTQWRDTRTRRRNLVRLGVSEALVRREIHGNRGLWAMSMRRAVCMGVQNDWLERRGLLSLEALCVVRFARDSRGRDGPATDAVHRSAPGSTGSSRTTMDDLRTRPAIERVGVGHPRPTVVRRSL